MGRTDKQLKLISGRIRNLRELKGFSQEYMAHKLHISVSAYSRIERCEISLTVEKLLQIKEILSADINTIIEGESYYASNIISDSGMNPKLPNDHVLNEALRGQIDSLKDQIELMKSIIDKNK